MKKDSINLLIIYVFVSFLGLINISLPGLYLDSINPDYLALHILRPENVSAWIYNDNFVMPYLPILNSLYGINTPAYVMVIWGSIFGFGISSVRALHLLYTLLLLTGFYYYVKSVFQTSKGALVFTILLGIDPSIILGMRTQYYLQLVPYIFFFPGCYAVVQELYGEKRINNRVLFTACVLLGLAAAGYFIFAIYGAVALALICLKLYFGGELRNKGKGVLCGFVLGFSPFVYGHFSIMANDGIAGWLSHLRGLDTYGISAGQQAGVIERIRHFLEGVCNIFGGNHVVQMITGQNYTNYLMRHLLVLFLVSVAVLIMDVVRRYFRKKENLSKLLDNKTGFNSFLCILIIIAHGVFSVFLGTVLGYQHYIMLLPLAYLCISSAGVIILNKCLSLSTKYSVAVKCGVCLCVYITIICSAFCVNKAYVMIKDTTGVGYYSKVVNDIAYYCKEETGRRDIIISPQWGYWMGIAMITNGERKVIIDTDEAVLSHNIKNAKQSGKYHIIVDSKTNKALVEKIISQNRIKIIKRIPFKDQGNILKAEILIGEKTD